MRELSYVQALNEAIREEMLRDEKVFMLGEDIAGVHGGAFKVSKGLTEEFGSERIRNTPISEAAIIGAALGAAITGMRPIAELMYMDFSAVAMDQIINQVAKIRYMLGGQARVPLVIRGQGGSGRGNAAQHSQSLETWFCHIPGLIVIQPSTPYDAKGLLKSAIRNDNPVMFVEHKMLYSSRGMVPEEEYLVPIGEAEIKRAGTDVTIIATSWMVPRALGAAEQLAADGVNAEVIDPRTLVPLDKETILSSVRKTNRTVVVHEATRFLGIGSEIAAMIQEEAFDDLDAPVFRLGGKFAPIPFSPVLEKSAIPTQEEIVAAVKGLL